MKLETDKIIKSAKIRQEKSDKTRLENLLKLYRNDIINNYHKNVPKYQIAETVQLIDKAILTILIGINKR